MKEVKNTDRSYIYNLKFYFSFDEEDFEGEWKPGQVKQRAKKSLNRDPNGHFVLEIWEHRDKYKAMDFSTTYYELEESEILDCINKALEQKKITEKQKNDFLSEYYAPFKKSIRYIDDVVVFDNGLYKLFKSSGKYYLGVKNENYKLTCHPYEPCTYIEGRCIHNAFDIIDIFESFRDNLIVSSITGRKYTAKDFCDLVYAMIENNLIDENIGYMENILWGEKKDINSKNAPQKQSFGGAAEQSEAEGATQIVSGEHSDDDLDESTLETNFGYKLEGTLRERIIRMMEIAGDEENRKFNISSIKASYNKAKVNLYPTAEKYLSRYAYLFSSMSPTFKYAIDSTRFFFDCYDSVDEITDQVELLKKATFDTTLPDTGYNFSKIYLKIKEKALCNITAVGLFGIKQPSTVYIGENGKLYATKGDINDIRVYDSLIDLLEYELKDHIPMGITD